MNDQWKRQTIGIAGCGGLGGHLVENALRLGIKHLVVCDGDAFEPTNMDRQILCTADSIGRNKVEVARERATGISTDIILEAHNVFIDTTNGEDLFRDCVLVLDGLDSMADRESLRSVCRNLHVPLIHGAICDWSVQVGVLRPGDLFPKAEATVRREEQVLSFAPAVCAGLQMAEAVKILRGEKSPLEGRIRYFDLKQLDSYELLLDRE